MYEGRVMINYPTVKAWEELMVNSYIKSANFDIKLVKNDKSCTLTSRSDLKRI